MSLIIQEKKSKEKHGNIKKTTTKSFRVSFFF